MSRQTIAPGAWRLLFTTTRDTLISIEGGNVRLMTGVTTNVPFDDGALLKAGDSLVIPTGLQVSLYAENNGVAVTDIAFGA
jgi:hypothetical protein